jgi:hypothetical protein
MPKVRTTMQPHIELDVSDAEAAQLARQGLLVKSSKSESSPSAAAPADTPQSGKSSSKE